MCPPITVFTAEFCPLFAPLGLLCFRGYISKDYRETNIDSSIWLMGRYYWTLQSFNVYFFRNKMSLKNHEGPIWQSVNDLVEWFLNISRQTKKPSIYHSTAQQTCSIYAQMVMEGFETPSEAKEQLWLQMTCFIIQVDGQPESQCPTRFQGALPDSPIEERSVWCWGASYSVKIEATLVSNYSENWISNLALPPPPHQSLFLLLKTKEWGTFHILL